VTAALALAAFSFIAAMAIGSVPFLVSAKNSGIQLNRLTALAAGFLIGAAMLIAVPEGLLLYGETSGDTEYLHVGVALMAGFVFMLLMETFGFSHDIHEEHHDHVHEHGHSHVNHPTARVPYAVVGLTIHAVIDGMIIGIALAQDALALSVSLILAITMHKLPAAFSVSAFSLHERHDRKRSYFDLTLFSLSTPIAILIFYLLAADISTQWQGLATLFAAGTFLYVASVDVLPSIHEPRRSMGVVWPLLAGVAGSLVIALVVDMVLGHVH
jgi:zinc transporter ZupT